MYPSGVTECMVRPLVAAVAVPFAMVALAVGVGPPTNATDATELDGCTTIDESGTYHLTADVENGGGTAISKACFRITADDVTFDGNGHAIDGRGVSHTKGVTVARSENVTLQNFTATDWHAGVRVENGSATIRDVASFSNAYGVRLEAAGGSALVDTAIDDNLVGVIKTSENVSMKNNSIGGNEISIREINRSRSASE